MDQPCLKTVDGTLYLLLAESQVPVRIEKRKGTHYARLKIENQEIVLHMPYTMSKARAKEILESKYHWLSRQWNRLQSLRQEISQRPPHHLELLGHAYLVKRILEADQQQARIVHAQDTITIHQPVQLGDKWRDFLAQWLRNQAETIIKRRLAIIAQHVNIQYNKVSVRDQKTKWGSCSSQGNLSFNWRLILFPQDIMDYIIVHELCHLKELNHSPDFWNHVKAIMPSYAVHRRWLKHNGQKAALLLAQLEPQDS